MSKDTWTKPAILLLKPSLKRRERERASILRTIGCELKLIFRAITMDCVPKNTTESESLMESLVRNSATEARFETRGSLGAHALVDNAIRMAEFDSKITESVTQISALHATLTSIKRHLEPKESICPLRVIYARM